MLDYRIYTFLKLCESMNYRVTSEILNITQPAVTQHIQFLEREYGCKLFNYNNKKLTKTKEGLSLEKHARAMIYNELSYKETLKPSYVKKISIGATKTIGEYTIENEVMSLLSQDNINLEVIIDNTKNLFKLLNSFKLDILLIEGSFDKKNYDFKLIQKEELIGICEKNHPFAGREVSFKDLLKEKIILREEGSGTREVFLKYLYEYGYSYDNFQRKACLSSFKLIEKAVEGGHGISFVYSVIPNKNKNLSTFRIKGRKISYEFNYVYLKNAYIENKLSLLQV